MKIVFLDVKTVGEDIDLSAFDKLGEVVKYPFTSYDDIDERAKDADVLVINKIKINSETIKSADHLKLVCVTATGTDNLDKDYLDKKGIAWRNVAGYSTESVAQHTFALLFHLLENLNYYERYVKEGNYINDTLFTHFDRHFHELGSMTFGIVGLGNIGRRVAQIATCFGSKVIYYSPSGAAPQDGYNQVDFDTLLRESDIVSVHAPLNEYTKGLMNADAFNKMKSNAIFLNLGRGPIVVEKDLTEAIKNNKIKAAGLDVLEVEPMKDDSPFIELKDYDNFVITPHIAWASVEARTNLMKIIECQIKDFFNM